LSTGESTPKRVRIPVTARFSSDEYLTLRRKGRQEPEIGADGTRIFTDEHGEENVLESGSDDSLGLAPTLTLPRAKSMPRRGDRSPPPFSLRGGLRGGLLQSHAKTQRSPSSCSCGLRFYRRVWLMVTRCHTEEVERSTSSKRGLTISQYEASRRSSREKSNCTACSRRVCAMASQRT